MVYRIRSENDEFQIIRSLKLNRAKRNRFGEIFIEGIESIKQAVRADLEITRIITGNIGKLSKWGKEFLAKNEKSAVIELREDLYSGLCDRGDPSELLITAKKKTFTLDDIVAADEPFILLLDRPSDCGNLGSLIRSANSFQVDAIFITGHAVDMYDPKVIRSSLGTVFHSKIVNLQSTDELKNWIDKKKRRTEIQIIGTDSSGGSSLENVRLKKPIVLILGNEAKGMSLALKELCGHVIKIPTAGDANSLNVACAGTVFLWEVYKNSMV